MSDLIDEGYELSPVRFYRPTKLQLRTLKLRLSSYSSELAVETNPVARIEIERNIHRVQRQIKGEIPA